MAMSNVISIATVRAEKLKQALAIHGRNGEAVIVETRRGGQVIAEKTNCRERFVEVFDRFGDYFTIDYNDIRALHPAAVEQTSAVNARGQFLPTFNIAVASRPAVVLPFDRRPRK
jgi:hypothetical protein